MKHARDTSRRSSRLRGLVASAIAVAIGATGLVALATTASATNPDTDPGEGDLCGVVEEVSHQEYKYRLTETTGWVLKSPGDDWTLIDTKTVIDAAATLGTWQVWSPNRDQGPFEGPPSWPADARGTWSEPKTTGGPDQDTLGTFNASNENSGHSSWFHRVAGTAAVTHLEYMYKRITTTGWLEESPGQGYVTIDEKKVITVNGNPGYPCDEEVVLIPVTPTVSVSDPTCYIAGSAVGSVSGDYTWASDPRDDGLYLIATKVAGANVTLTKTEFGPYTDLAQLSGETDCPTSGTPVIIPETVVPQTPVISQAPVVPTAVRTATLAETGLPLLGLLGLAGSFSLIGGGLLNAGRVLRNRH